MLHDVYKKASYPLSLVGPPTSVLVNVVEVQRVGVPGARHGEAAGRGVLERACRVEAEAPLHALQELLARDVEPVAREEAMVCERVEDRTGAAAYVDNSKPPC